MVNSRENDAGLAKLHSHQNSCTIDDVEICLRGVDVIYDVNMNGDETNYIEAWHGESYPAYYHCRECGDMWEIDRDSTQGQANAFELVKEHLNGN